MESRISTVPHETLLLYSGRVIVGQDGNGVTADRFPTTTDGDQVRYFLGLITAGVEQLTITLNDDVVLVTQLDFDRDRVEVALNPTDTDLNTIVIAASGVPNSAARVAVLAVRPPPEVFFGGLSVLPWAEANDLVRTFLAVHNAGAAQMSFRLAFFNEDGSVAGRTAPQRLGGHATRKVNLNEAATGLVWTRGAVHVEWVANGLSRVSSAASEERSKPNGEDSQILVGIRTLPLDDYFPRVITSAAAEEFGF